MTSRIVITLLILALLSAIGFAAWIYITKQSLVSTPNASPTPTVSPLPTASPSPGLPAKTYLDTQPLAIANQTTSLTPGSGLLTIAATYKVSLTTLLRVNGITNPDLVAANQTLVIPDQVDGTNYTILYVTNTAREQKESQKIQAGNRSVYSDPLVAAQTDAKGIAGIGLDTPFSQSPSGDQEVVLTTTNSDRLITIKLKKLESGIWAINQLSIKWLMEEETS